MSVPIDALSQEPTRALLRAEYDALVAAGFFEGEPVELLQGRLVLMSPEGAGHSATIMRLTKLLVVGIGDRAWVRIGHPFAASDISEPEPDVAVTPLGEYDEDHPTTALLLVEVAHSSQRRDRVVKPAIYAAAGVPEYWVVDLNTDSVTVLREPQAAGYASARTFRRGDAIALLQLPDVELALVDFLPPLR